MGLLGLPAPPSKKVHVCQGLWLWARSSTCVRLVTAPFARGPVSVLIVLGGFLSLWVTIRFSPLLGM